MDKVQAFQEAVKMLRQFASQHDCVIAGTIVLHDRKTDKMHAESFNNLDNNTKHENT